MILKEQKEILIAQLFAARTQIDATLTVLGVQVVDSTPEECEHPVDQREILTTMGGPNEWRCRACGYHYSENKTEE